MSIETLAATRLRIIAERDAEIATLKAELSAASDREQHALSRLQHLAHDLVEAQAKARNFLDERVRRFVDDAIDAIDLAETGIALRRLRSVLTAVKTYG